MALERLGILYARLDDATPEAAKFLNRYVNGDGVIVGWGLNRDGELGTCTRYNLLTPFMIGGYDKPVRMACTGMSSVWLGVRSLVIAMGSGVWGELGVGNPHFCPQAIDDENHLPICPGQTEVTRFLAGDDDAAVDVTAGFAYVVCVSAKGDVFAWGANNYGQCHPDLNNACCGYAQRRHIADEVVVQVAATNYTVLVRTLSGAVYGWGLTQLLGASDEELQAQAQQQQAQQQQQQQQQQLQAGAAAADLHSVNSSSTSSGMFVLVPSAQGGERIAACQPLRLRVFDHLGGDTTTTAAAKKAVSGSRRRSEDTNKRSGSASSSASSAAASSSASRVVLLRAGPWHFAAVTASGAVYTWGLGNNGRLGHGDESDRVAPTRVEALAQRSSRGSSSGSSNSGTPDVEVIEVACGSFHTVFVARDGAAYACGDNQGGQCGVVGEAVVLVPQRMHIVANRRVVHAACGRHHTTLLLESGDVVAYGTGIAVGVGVGYGMRHVRCQPVMDSFAALWLASGPTHAFALAVPRTTSMHIFGLPHRGVPCAVPSVGLKEGVLSCAAGAGFTVMVNRRGSCYSFGVGGWGQLGMDVSQVRTYTPERVPVVRQATRVAYFVRSVVTHVAAGFSFALAITEGERVFAWGNNSYAQCGLGVDPNMHQRIAQPREVTWLCDKKIVQVACGSYFALALSAAGDVYSWGTIECCGVGLHPRDDEVPWHMLMRDVGVERRCVVLSPVKVTALQHIVQVAAGGWHALALNAIGEVYAWGIGAGGRLGLGDLDNRYTPTWLKHSAFFTRIGCGCYTSYALDDDARLFLWGVNEHGQLGIPATNSGAEAAAAAAGAATGGSSGGVAAAAVTDITSVSSSSSVQPTPVAVLERVREVGLGKHYTLALTYDGTFHFAGTLEHEQGKYTSTSFHDTDALPNRLKPASLQSARCAGLRIFAGLEHAIVLVENYPTPPGAVEEVVQRLRYQPEAIIAAQYKKQQQQQQQQQQQEQQQQEQQQGQQQQE